jgi:NADPH-ferrihemoprotein reductase
MIDSESNSRLPYGPTNNDQSDDNIRPRAIILASTYGEGEPTDNATVLVNSIKDTMDDESQSQSQVLKTLDYCVFGLGNTEYEIYNAMGKYFDSSLEKLGGNRILKMGLGDDSDDLENDFEKWKDSMWIKLKKLYIKRGTAVTKSNDDEMKLPDCEYSIEYHTEVGLDSDSADRNRGLVPIEKIASSSKNYFTSLDCPVTLVKELRSSDDKGSTVHVEIDISKAKDKSGSYDYMTADNLGVLPCNSTTVVEDVASALNYNLDSMFSLKAGLNPDNELHEWHGLPFPTPISVRELLTRYLDLTSAPRRSDLKLLSSYAKQPLDRKVLQRLSSKDGKQDYKSKILDDKVGLVQLLKLCPSLEIPLEHLIGNICRFQLPRFYTISSCPKVYPNSIHITVAVTQEERPTGDKNSNGDLPPQPPMFEGVASTHIAKQNDDDKSSSLQPSLRVFVRPSTFRLPKDLSTPIIMIGPGTGIAPMRALLQDRKYQQQQQQEEEQKEEAGYNVLYFGCKNENLDYIYHDELMQYQNDGTLNKLYLAFSRKDPKKKEYVQHLLRQNSNETYKLLTEQNAYVYVCGGVKMGHDVTETLKEILIEQSSSSTMTQQDATNYLSKLSNDGRFVQELWS